MTKNNLKITLVNPPLSAKEQAGSLEDVANILQPLGIGYIAAVLEKEHFDINIIDCRPLNITSDQLIEILKKDRPDIIGFTSTILEIKKCSILSRKIKQVLPTSLLIIGGPHLSSLPLETMKDSSFDIGGIGEGELTMLEICEQVRDNKLNLKSIKGIIYREDEKLHITEPRPFIEDLDSLPFPARHLYPPLSKYKPVPASYIKRPLGHMMTSRGCPYQCTFCDRKVFGNRTRFRSPKNVVDEIEEMINIHGAREIKFFDDTFTLNNQRTIEICDEIIKRGIKVPWSCLTRVNNVTKPLLGKMKKAGCWQVAYGLESGDQRILDKMKKGITLEQSRNAVKWAKEAGINIRAFFILGTPGETSESIRKTVTFAKELPIDVATFYIVTLYPGNELYQIAQREGTILHQDYSQYNPIIDVRHSKLAYVPEGMTEEELRHTISKAYKDFYLRPSYILKQVLTIRRPQDVVRYWRAFKTIIAM